MAENSPGYGNTLQWQYENRANPNMMTGSGGGLYGALSSPHSGGTYFQQRRGQADIVQHPDYGDMGVPGFDRQYNQFGQMMNGGSRYEQDQRGLGRILAAEASGNGVGQQLVGMQARQAADRASNQQFAALGGARPGMQAMASRNAMLGTALAQSAVGEQAALGSANMTLGAQGQYGQFLQGARGQDLSQQGQNLAAGNSRAQLAGMQQQGNQFNANLGNSRWLAAYGGVPQQQSKLDKYGGAAMGFLSAYNMSPGQGG